MALIKVLLLKDVNDLGYLGDIVNVKTGFARNFLLPEGLAIVADRSTVKLQEKLQEERKKRRELDKKNSETLALSLADLILEKIVKVDEQGHMYGSVSATDILHMLKEEKEFILEKNAVVMKKPIKQTGEHKIELRLKEGIPAFFTLKVISEQKEQTAPPEQEQTD